MIDTFGTGKLSDDAIAERVSSKLDLRPAAIIERLGLRRPIYEPLAAYGHMGREDVLAPWEACDLGL